MDDLRVIDVDDGNLAFKSNGVAGVSAEELAPSNSGAPAPRLLELRA